MNKIEKQVKIIGIMIILAGLGLLILVVYFIYCLGVFKDLSGLYFLLLGSLFIIAGFGLVKFKNWARRMMLYIVAAHFLASTYMLFYLIRITLSPKIDHINTDYHLLIYSILVIVFQFVIIAVLPVVGIFSFLNSKEIRDFFGKKKIITNQFSE